jgi:HlyD family secretion protein
MNKLKNGVKKILAGKGKYIVIGLVVLVAIVGLSQGASGVDVQGTTVDVGTVQSYVEEVGDFEAKTAITMNGRVAGVVEAVLKVEGDQVKAGDLLITLDQGDQLLLIQGTEAEIAAVYAELAEAGRADKNKVAQVQSQIALAQNIYVQSKENYDNNKVLYDSGAVSKADLDTSKRSYQDSLQSLRIAQNDLTLLTKGVSESVKKRYESQIQGLTAKLELEKRQLEQMSIKAPIDGIVTDKFVKVGDVVNFGTPIIEVSDPSAFHITSDLLVSDAGNIQTGYKVVISDPESDQEWLGEISKIYPKAFTKLSDLGIEQKRIKVEIAPVDMTFNRFGYEFDLKIIFEEKTDVLRCKDSAVFKIDDASYVFEVKNGKTHLASVTVGLEGEEYLEVLEGLEEGTKLVQSPGNSIEENMKVTLKE